MTTHEAIEARLKQELMAILMTDYPAKKKVELMKIRLRELRNIYAEAAREVECVTPPNSERHHDYPRD